MDACVELVRDEYLVLSLPDRKAGGIGFAATQGYNQRSLDPHSRFRHGQRLAASVATLPSPSTGESCVPLLSQIAYHGSAAGGWRVLCGGAMSTLAAECVPYR